VANVKKNAAAVALGRLGGLKGGKARAKKLSAERRREIALKAVSTKNVSGRIATDFIVEIHQPNCTISPTP